MVSDVFDRNCYNVDMLYIAWRKWRNRRFRGFGPSYISIYIWRNNQKVRFADEVGERDGESEYRGGKSLQPWCELGSNRSFPVTFAYLIYCEFLLKRTPMRCQQRNTQTSVCPALFWSKLLLQQRAGCAWGKATASISKARPWWIDAIRRRNLHNVVKRPAGQFRL